MNVWFQTHGEDIEIRTVGFAGRLLGAGGVIWFYLYKALLPVDLAFIYPQWRIEAGNPLWWLPLLAALVVTAVLWRYRQGWSRPLLFAWGFFCVALAPVMGFVDVYFMKFSLVADHYQHIALVGVIVLVAAGWSVWHQRLQEPARWAAKVVALVVAGTLMLLTYQQSGLYRGEITLYQAALEKNPDSWMTHNNLGAALFQAGRLPESIEHFRQALQLKSNLLQAQNNLGKALLQVGRLQESIEHYRQALQLKSDDPDAHYSLGVALDQAGQLQEAIKHYQQALRLKPDYPEAHNNLGILLFQTGRSQAAIEHFEEALRLKSDFIMAYSNLASAYAGMHQATKAIATAQKALELARSQGQTAEAKRIEDWLNSYRASLSGPPSAAPPSK